jgi:limonene-1,2-epoxide hydrolase
MASGAGRGAAPEEPGVSAADLAAFLERFVRFGAAPSVASYTALFHPEATLFDDGMERPLTRPEIPAHIEATLALIPGFAMTPERWRAGGPAVFVEARNEAKLAGERVHWRSVYRVELEGSLVLRGRRFFDRAPLLARVDPKLPRLPALSLEAEAGGGAAVPPPGPECAPGAEALAAHCAEAWRAGRPEAVAALFREDGALAAPGLPRPLGGGEIARYYRWLAGVLGGPRLALRRAAGDDGLVFLEWEGQLATPRGSYALGMVERFDLAGGRVLAARAYFDTAALARALEAPPEGR